ncbi:MAG: DUF3300 domain-containing protein [Acidobacteriaceae bacterium]|nr:DUF3300 domain-containing protein [Acidobacteriaceae bacterium]
MPLKKIMGKTLAVLICLWSLIVPVNEASAQAPMFSPDQIDQLVAPIALFPDALVAQICAASSDPQQILDVNNWLNANMRLTGQARTNAAQAQGFDPAFIALVNFPQVLDMMAQNINDYAALGQVFVSNQGLVMDSVQRLRQQAYAWGALESNQYQTVDVQSQNGSQVIVIQPTNPQVVFVPQYDPSMVWALPGSSALVTASLLSFGTGIMLGSWFGPSYPWGWNTWGWGWGSRRMMWGNNVWIVNNRWRPVHRTFRPRPPSFRRPVYARPPSNWRDRPNRRVAGGRPPAASRPPAGGRPAGNRPGGNVSGNRPNRPGNAAPNRPAQNRPQTRPAQPSANVNRPAQRPATGAAARPAQTATARPAVAPTVARPAAWPQQAQPRGNPNAGFASGPRGSSASGRANAFSGGGSSAAANRSAANRGRASMASMQRTSGRR